MKLAKFWGEKDLDPRAPGLEQGHVHLTETVNKGGNKSDLCLGGYQ